MELTLTAWGAANVIMQVWNYLAMLEPKRDPLALSRTLTNFVPGQLCRFLFAPDIPFQKPYFIPAAIGGVLIVLGYLGSVGIAIAEMVRLWQAEAEFEVLEEAPALGVA